jgi:hypothetical protein
MMKKNITTLLMFAMNPYGMRDIGIAELFSSSNDCTLIFSHSGKTIIESKQKTLRPLVEAITLINKCNKIIVYDKTIGLAAAKLHSLLNPHQVYASIMSKEAAEFLKKNGIPYHCHKLVEVIITENKRTCPYDILARRHDAEELYDVLKETYKID